MSKTATLAPAAPKPSFWRRWRFHLSALLLIVPIVYVPKYFENLALSRGLMYLGQRPAGDVQVGNATMMANIPGAYPGMPGSIAPLAGSASQATDE